MRGYTLAVAIFEGPPHDCRTCTHCPEYRSHRYAACDHPTYPRGLEAPDLAEVLAEGCDLWTVADFVTAAEKAAVLS